MIAQHWPSPLPREAEFILACLSVSPDTSKPPPVDLNWENVRKISRDHGLAPVLYPVLTSYNNIPSTDWDALRMRALSITARNSVLMGQVFSILKLLQENDIPAIPYKGPVLAHLLYGNISLRDFADLDILIRKKDVYAVKDLLLEQGYRPQEYLSQLTTRQERALLHSHYSYDFVRYAANQQLEIHWDITPKAFGVKLDYERIWNTCPQISLEGHPVSTLEPEDLLLFVSISGAKKLWDRLIRILDVAKILERYPALDWDMVIRRAREARVERILCIAVLLGTRLFDAKTPEEIRKMIQRDPVSKDLTRQVLKRLFADSTQPMFMQRYDQFQPLHFQMRERVNDRLRYLWMFGMIPGIGDWKWVQLPDPLYSLYYLLRPIRLFFKLISRMLSFPERKL